MERFIKITEAINDIKNGKMVVVTDNDYRENEGDLIMAGEMITPEAVNFMAKYGRGLICAPISLEYANRLGLEPMSMEKDKQGTAFTVSCDLKEGTSTGISASDRAKTIKALADPSSKKEDFNRPGHMFPLISKDGGVLNRDGHTEAATDLAIFAGFTPCGAICEIVNDNGTMARKDDLIKFCNKFNLKLITIEELKEYKRFIYNKAATTIPTKHGVFKVETINNIQNKDMPHLLIFNGKLENPLNLRVHSECLTGDLLGSLKCDCGDQLQQSFKYIKENNGAILYLRQEGRGIGLTNKLSAYNLQELGFDTVDANLLLGFKEDEREYSVVSDVLHSKGINLVNLLTNNPLKIKGLESLGIKINKRIPLIGSSCSSNKIYLETKKDRMGHLI